MPVSLASVAEAETLPLSYLEHLVARLREAGLVGSVRGAHGGYRLAKPAGEITMLDVVEALEGPIAPMECFHAEREGRVLCSHETDADRACATKLLWTRVQGGVTKALAGHYARRPRRVRRRTSHRRGAAGYGLTQPNLRRRPWPTSKSETCT